MLFFNANTYLIALAAIPSFLVVTNASPTQVQARDEKPLLFSKDGPSLDDIVLNVAKGEHRSETSMIFSQVLIALRKLDPRTITLWFDKDKPDGQSDIHVDQTTVRPYYFDDTSDPKKPETVDVTLSKAKEEAGDEVAGEEVVFGHSDDAAWWPYAMYSGALQAGWGKIDNIDIKGTILVQDTLQILSGLGATSMPIARFGENFYKDLSQADTTPFILQLSFESKEYLESQGKRFEKFVTVMSFDESTKKLDYATSYYDGEGGITEHDVDIEALMIVNVIFLTNHDTFKGERSPDHSPSSALAPAPAQT